MHPFLSSPPARERAAVPASGSQLSKATEEPPALCSCTTTALASVSSHPLSGTLLSSLKPDEDGCFSLNCPRPGPVLKVRGERGRALLTQANCQGWRSPRFKMEKGTGQGAHQPNFPTAGTGTQPTCGSTSHSSTRPASPQLGGRNTELLLIVPAVNPTSP